MKMLLFSFAASSLLLAGVSSPVRGIFLDAKNTQSLANARQLATALELYYLDHSQYPSSLSNISDYLASPLSNLEFYTYESNGSKYTLCAQASNKNNCITM
jgi:type II secretory pathway pseudopilin PulG